SSSNIVTMATTSRSRRARMSAAQLSLPPLHEIAAFGFMRMSARSSKRDAQAAADGAPQGAVAERLHVVLVGDVVDRHERAHLRGQRVRRTHVPRDISRVLENRRLQR